MSKNSRPRKRVFQSSQMSYKTQWLCHETWITVKQRHVRIKSIKQANKQTENSTDEVPRQWHLELLTAHTKRKQKQITIKKNFIETSFLCFSSFNSSILQHLDTVSVKCGRLPRLTNTKFQENKPTKRSLRKTLVNCVNVNKQSQIL